MLNSKVGRSQKHLKGHYGNNAPKFNIVVRNGNVISVTALGNFASGAGGAAGGAARAGTAGAAARAGGAAGGLGRRRGVRAGGGAGRERERGQGEQ